MNPPPFRLAGLLLLFAGFSLFAQVPVAVRIEHDVSYLPSNRVEQADLYLLENSASKQLSPAVLIIHGGGWNSGDKGAGREINIGTNLALHGYVDLSINYALSTTGRVTWPQNLHDCKTAVRWLRANAGRLHIDPDRIGVIGGSAGGHLAAMLAVTGPADGLGHCISAHKTHVIPLDINNFQTSLAPNAERICVRNENAYSANRQALICYYSPSTPPRPFLTQFLTQCQGRRRA